VGYGGEAPSRWEDALLRQQHRLHEAALRRLQPVEVQQALSSARTVRVYSYSNDSSSARLYDGLFEN